MLSCTSGFVFSLISNWLEKAASVSHKRPFLFGSYGFHAKRKAIPSRGGRYKSAGLWSSFTMLESSQRRQLWSNSLTLLTSSRHCSYTMRLCNLIKDWSIHALLNWISLNSNYAIHHKTTSTKVISSANITVFRATFSLVNCVILHRVTNVCPHVRLHQARLFQINPGSAQANYW